MGKTAFVLNLASNILHHNHGVAFFSLEMPAEQLMLRMLSAKTSIPLQSLRIGDLDDTQWGHLAKAADFYAGSKLFVDDDGMLTIHKLRSKLRELKSKHPEIELAVIDYLQLMSGGNSVESRQQEISNISRGLKLLARELEIPIIALSQLNRSLESRSDKRPMMSDIRESGAIEQDADIIMFVYRENVYVERELRDKIKDLKNAEKRDEQKIKEMEAKLETMRQQIQEEAEIIIGKHRNGPIGTIEMMFQKPFTRFVDGPGKEVHHTTHVYKETQIPVTVEKSPPKIDMPTI